ncbi:MAG: hypothetical protein HRT88_09605 [Lentisphaeraceae bacterium]|nr:hypothetical protein [Lentisphaeraceae bacterium]
MASIDAALKHLLVQEQHSCFIALTYRQKIFTPSWMLYQELAVSPLFAFFGHVQHALIDSRIYGSGQLFKFIEL